MKKKIVSIVLAAAVLILTLNFFNFGCVKAEGAGDAYTIEWVNHRVEVMYNGYILINDTIKISGAAPSGFLIGFPYKYGSHVLYRVAYNPADPTQKYSVISNVPLENRIGFYGVKVELPQQGITNVFTVVFVLSNSLLEQDAQNTNLFTLDFPAYPSLTTKALVCNASVVLPKSAEYVNGTIASFDYAENFELPAFTYEPANVTFTLTEEDILLFAVEELRREFRIGGSGEIEVSDQYYIRNLSPKEITFVNVVLPPNASAITAEDEFGRRAETPTLIDAETNRYRVSLVLPVESGRSTIFVVKYALPKAVYIKHGESADLKFAPPAFQHLNYYIEKVYATFVLPEGAEIVALDFDGNLIREVFQEKVIVSKQGVFFLDSLTIEIAYKYNPLWLAFRPTLWIWTLAVLGCFIAAILKRPKAPSPVVMPTVTVRLTPEVIKSFVDSYEEKRKTILEIKSLETGVRRGRIPRRRYKVQRKTLEIRLGALSRTLEDLKQQLRAAGGRYADLARQLDVAENEISEAEANIRTIEARYSRGELSLEAYRKLLGDYERRKDDAETRISGILVRLREEMR